MAMPYVPSHWQQKQRRQQPWVSWERKWKTKIDADLCPLIWKKRRHTTISIDLLFEKLFAENVMLDSPARRMYIIIYFMSWFDLILFGNWLNLFSKSFAVCFYWKLCAQFPDWFVFGLSSISTTTPTTTHKNINRFPWLQQPLSKLWRKIWRLPL